MLIFYHETTFFPRWCKIAHPQWTDYFDYWELEVGCRLSEDPEVGWVVLADLAVVVVAGGGLWWWWWWGGGRNTNQPDCASRSLPTLRNIFLTQHKLCHRDQWSRLELFLAFILTDDKFVQRDKIKSEPILKISIVYKSFSAQ